MSDLGVQLSLPRPMMELSDELIQRPKDLLRAFVMSADLGGLEDKQAAAAAGMDAATWSRFKQGDVGIRPNNLMSLREQVGNDLPLAHWAFRCGYGLHPLESELERRLRRERERAEKAEEKVKMLSELLAGRPVGL